MLALLDKKNTQQLLGNNPELFPPACFVQLRLSKPWRKIKHSKTQLEQIIYPKTLAKGFPYPTPFSKERRIRPAYYYRQSAVIPYRFNKGRLEILIISSSKNNHYVIPKGIIEPGLSSLQSAAKEAYEEAGIKGTIDLNVIGKYSTIKWKAETTIEVFSMKVTQVVDDKYWTEKHRGREWLSFEDAIKILHQQELKPILLKFQQQLKLNKNNH